MPEQQPKLPIEPSLFDYVIETADALNANDMVIDAELRGNDPLVLFLENFVAQFASNILKVKLQGLSPAALEEWTAQRRSLESVADTDLAQSLMFNLERTFNLIGELSYGGGDADLRGFREEYVPEVLEMIVGWAEDWPDLDPQVISAAKRARSRYTKAVGV